MNDLKAIKARVDKVYEDQVVGQMFDDVMFLLLENMRLETALETANDDAAGVREDYQFGLKRLARYEQYTAFIASCIRSGERPATFEDFSQKMADYWREKGL